MLYYVNSIKLIFFQTDNIFIFLIYFQVTVIPLTGVLCYLLSKFQMLYIFLNIWLIAKLRFEINRVAYVYKLMKKKVLIILI